MNFDLVTADFIDQVLYTTTVRELLAGIAPENSERLYELRQFKYYKLGLAFHSGMTAIQRAQVLNEMIKEHYTRAKILAGMLDEDRHDKQLIVDYINDLYAEAELAVRELQTLRMETLDE